MPYYIVQFVKPKKHRAGFSNRDIKRIGPSYSNQHKAEAALVSLMYRNKVDNQFVRIDRNVSPNAVVYADLRADGGVVRIRQRDGVHFSRQLTLTEFQAHVARQEKQDAILGDTVRETAQPR